MKITIEVDPDRVVRCISEARIRYWAHDINWKPGDCKLTFLDLDDRYWEVTSANFVYGLSIMAVYQPKHFGDFMGRTSDSVTGDILIQMAAFGEVIYQ